MTIVPEFYDSFSEDHQNMTFTEFLQNVGISFPDQQVATLQSPLSRPLSKAPVTLKEEAVAAAATLPELKLYQSLAGNIRKQIQEGLQDLQKIDDDVRENNPQFFGEYMDGEPRLRQEMESRFFANRDLAQLEANKKWMTQLKTLLDTSVQQLHDKEILEEKDRSILRDTDLYIKKHLPDLLTHQHELSRLTKEWQEREIKYKNTNHTAIMKWEKEFKEQTAILEKTKQDVIVAERSAKQIVDRVADLKQRKEDLLKAIAEAEKVIEDHPYVSERDLIDAKDNFDLCSTLCAWQSLEKSDKKLEMVLFGDLDVQIDLLKLQAHQMDAVFIGMIEARERDYGAFAELIHGLQVMSRNLWTSNQIVQNIAMYWNRLLLIQHEVTKVQRRFWIDVDCLADANDAPVDPEQRGVACAITVFSYAHQLKFVLAFQLRAKQVMNYPHSLDLTSLSIKKHYGPVSSEQLEQCAMEKIRKNGIIDLVSTINSIINETLSSK
ncbi:hypothetical protein DM01DRAFT_1059408 [Hesseltinella vesiculosa]|uniref:Spc7 kinetochore protein domain-containing protein n=1 Tax=Hesseltinella vesiculosa TaxID=101127 RepID=A0A1X2GEW9_9FUNG|nr:hypothetical protein DM01DRAFT_1059408 [Hesseltinella vesiculosa]